MPSGLVVSTLGFKVSEVDKAREVVLKSKLVIVVMGLIDSGLGSFVGTLDAETVTAEFIEFVGVIDEEELLILLWGDEITDEEFVLCVVEVITDGEMVTLFMVVATLS